MNFTKQDFEVYKKECLKWISKLGMTDWEVTFEFSPLEDAIAQFEEMSKARQVTFTLNSNQFVSGLTKREELKSTAFHEVFELLLTELANTAYMRITTDDLIIGKQHEIVHKVWNILKDKR